jgi:hypothetical protein
MLRGGRFEDRSNLSDELPSSPRVGQCRHRNVGASEERAPSDPRLERQSDGARVLRFSDGSGIDFVGHATSKQSTLALVAAGCGITLAVESQSMLAWPGVVLRPIREPDACVDMSLAWLTKRGDAAAPGGRLRSRPRAHDHAVDLRMTAGPRQTARRSGPPIRGPGGPSNSYPKREALRLRRRTRGGPRYTASRSHNRADQSARPPRHRT